MSYNKIRRFKGPRGRISKPGLYVFTGTGATTFNIITPQAMDNAGLELDCVYLKNEGSAAWTISGSIFSASLGASIVLAAGESALLVPDNANWVKI